MIAERAGSDELANLIVDAGNAPFEWSIAHEPVCPRKLEQQYVKDLSREPTKLPPAPSTEDVEVQVCPNCPEQTELVTAMIADGVIAGRSYFLEGIAGTGKTWFAMNVLVPQLAEAHKTHVCLAPTNRAARNIGGQTLHRYFGIGVADDDDELGDFLINQTFYQRSNHPDVYLVDECSMLTEEMWGWLHEVRRMFADIVIVCLFDRLQCPPVPARPGARVAFGARREVTFFDNVGFVRREMCDEWIRLTYIRRSECE